MDYGNSTSVGTKISTTNAFKSGVSVSVGFGPGGGGEGGSGGSGGSSGGGGNAVNFGAGYTVTTTDSTTETITKSSGSDLSMVAIKDGVDHDQDQFVLLVNPLVNVAQQSSAVLWNLAFSGPFGVLQTLSVSELKNPSGMPSTVAQTFAKLGFTNSDFQTILAQDPYASGGSVDANRYIPTTFSFPYQPPDANDCAGGACSCTALQQPISNQLVNEVSNSLQNQVAVTLSSGFAVPGLLSLKSTDSFTFTNTATTANTVSNSQTASAQIQCPSLTYTGLTGMAAYWDALYGTFAFVPFDPATVAVIHRGTLTDSTGKPVRGAPITLSVGGLTYHTVSGKSGNYEFPVLGKNAKPISGIGRIAVKGVEQTVTLGSAAAAVHIRIP